MKVVLLNHSDSLGGASVVTYRLMEALREQGVDARMLVGHRCTDSPWVEQAAEAGRLRRPFLSEHLNIFVRNGLSRKRLFQVSLANAGLPLSRHHLIQEADIVVVNWVNQGMVSLSELRRIAQSKPLIWTMHDMWPMTGICHHAGDCRGFLGSCGNCPFLGPGAYSRDISHRVWLRKQRLYDAAPQHFVAVSNWLADVAGRSELLRKHSVSVIGNPFPVEKLSAPPAYSRSELGLPTEGRIILMCAARIDDPMKGLPEAIAGLNRLVEMGQTDVTVVFAGAVKSPEALSGLRMPYVSLGRIDDKERMHSVMCHASVVLSTSPFESFGATLLEGQAAGATPVCYTHDGRADIVEDGVSGYAIAPGDASVAVAEALRRALTAPISRQQLLQAATRFSGHAIARQYIDLFSQHLLGRTDKV